jgi:ABC-2 type transport system ATP-binding protein
MIEVEHLTKRYAGKTAIQDLNFTVAKGEIVGFLGPNGAGKSTTMRILSSYLPPTSGRVTVAGYDVFQKSLQARRRIGYMPEDVPLYGDMRVREFLKFRGQLKGLGGRRLRERMGAVVEQCSLRDVEKKLIGTLSKGYRQRVGLADALIHEPDLLILDEPTIGLDPNQIRSVRDLIRDLGQKHTILLSSHILSEVEIVCNRVLILHKGRIQASDTPDNLLKTIRRAGSIRLEVKGRDGEDPAVALREIKGVRDVAPSAEVQEGWHSLRMRIEADSDLREAIYALAVERGWTLRELSRVNATLEDVFVEITQTDEH